uniref:Uncharacterized protein n=1 Tax=Arundo donax TaxID=35708 RepID=A0A0A8Y834_ARUDO
MHCTTPSPQVRFVRSCFHLHANSSTYVLVSANYSGGKLVLSH